MYILEKIKNQIADALNKALGINVQASDLVYPPNLEMGDLSFPCFKSGIKPGSEIPNGLLEIDAVRSVMWAGAYLNFKLDKSILFNEVISEIEKEKENFGKNKNGKNKRVMIEYSNGNTHKEYHVGHVRNLCYGDSVNRILSANGFKSIAVSYINDFGIHVAKTLWAFEEFYKNEVLPENKGYFLGKVYVRATKEIEKNSSAKDMVAFIMKKIESRSGKEYELWEKTREWSIEAFDKIYKELGIEFKEIFYESEFIDKGREMVNDLIKKGILVESKGAIIADLEKENLGVLVVLRSDGTALYPVADLPLAMHKLDKYKLDKSIYVVDIRQGLYFKQLFKILEKMGRKEEMVHLGYDFVKLPDGMMSSRTGNIITYEELKNDLIKKFKTETESRHDDWGKEKIEEVARILTNGAIKFEMLKVGADQIITFDIEQASRFDGFTSAYLQYVYARIQSVLRNANCSPKVSGSFRLEEEADLIIKLSKYPEIVEQAGTKYDPSKIAKYLFELGQIFNDYYHKVPILKTENENLKKIRLTLLINVGQVLKNGLSLLGIEVIEEM